MYGEVVRRVVRQPLCNSYLLKLFLLTFGTSSTAPQLFTHPQSFVYLVYMDVVVLCSSPCRFARLGWAVTKSCSMQASGKRAGMSIRGQHFLHHVPLLLSSSSVSSVSSLGRTYHLTNQPHHHHRHAVSFLITTCCIDVSLLDAFFLPYLTYVLITGRGSSSSPPTTYDHSTTYSSSHTFSLHIPTITASLRW